MGTRTTIQSLKQEDMNTYYTGIDREGTLDELELQNTKLLEIVFGLSL